MLTHFLDPVLLCNGLGTKPEAAQPGSHVAGPVVPSSGHHSISVKEAVRIAQSNNFMGLVCNSTLLVSTSSALRGQGAQLIDTAVERGAFPH